MSHTFISQWFVAGSLLLHKCVGRCFPLLLTVHKIRRYTVRSQKVQKYVSESGLFRSRQDRYV